MFLSCFGSSPMEYSEGGATAIEGVNSIAVSPAEDPIKAQTLQNPLDLTATPSQCDPVALQAKLQRLREKQASVGGGVTPKVQNTSQHISLASSTTSPHSHQSHPQQQQQQQQQPVAVTPFDPAFHTAVDAEKEPTVLYQKLLRKNFRGALRRCEEAPHEIGIWIYKSKHNSSKEQQNEKNNPRTSSTDGDEAITDVKWRLLPLHAAIVLDAPLTLMEQLATPSTVTCPDDEGSLPIHLACRLGSPVAVVRLLLKLFPYSVHLPDNSGSTPSQVVQKNLHSAHHASLEYALEKCMRAHPMKMNMNMTANGIDAHNLPSMLSGDNSTVDTRELSSEDGQSAPSDTSSKLSEALTSLGELRQREYAFNNTGPPSVAQLQGQCSADDSSIGGEEASNQQKEDKTSPILECKERHLAELLVCKQHHEQSMHQVKMENEQNLEKQMQNLKAQQARELSLLAEQNEQQLQEQHAKDSESPETTTATDFNHEFLKLKTLHSAQVIKLKEEAIESHKEAEWRVQARFQRIVQKMEQRHKKEFTEALRAPAPTLPERDADSLDSRDTSASSRGHQQQSSPPSLPTIPHPHLHHLSEDNQKLFQETLNAMQTAFRQEVHNFQHQMIVTKEESDKHFLQHSAEHKRRYEKDIAAMDQRYSEKIAGIHSLLGDIHNELTEVRTEARRQSQKWDGQMKSLDNKIQKVSKTSRSQIKKKFQTIQKQMSNHQDDVKSIKEHMEELEDQLDDQNRRGQDLEQRVKDMRNSWLYCFG